MDDRNTEKPNLEYKRMIVSGYFICLASIVILTILYFNANKENQHLKEQLGSLNNNGMVNESTYELQLDGYRTQLLEQQTLLAESEARKQASTRLVERFILGYYESEYLEPFTKIAWNSQYLSDQVIRQLSPYINTPDEITKETIEKIRNHDQELITSDISQFQNTVYNIELYYEVQSKHKSTVFCYFILETARNGSAIKSPYLLRCEVLTTKDGNYVIDNITMRTPVILPAFDPETMALE